jgi:hypothetical protein
MARFTLTRESFIPKQPHQTIKSKKSPAIVYLFESKSAKPCAIGFYGKADKPAFHFNYRSLERRMQHVTQWIRDMDERAERRQARKTERKAFVHTLKVGDVLRNSWGYDQTNIDYFEVTRVIGKSVEIRAIAQEREETAHMQGKCVPVPGRYVGEPMRKLVQEGNCVKIHSWGSYARPVESKTIAGIKVYAASHWTAYH